MNIPVSLLTPGFVIVPGQHGLSLVSRRFADPIGNQQSAGWLTDMAACPTRDRLTVERHLQKALQHVIVGKRLIDKQRNIVATLEACGRPTRTARKLLGKFEAIQAMHVADRDRLIDELTRCGD
jgi:hypothetical protein